MAHPNGVLTFTTSISGVQVPQATATATTPTDLQGGGGGGTTGGGQNSNYDQHRSYFEMKTAELKCKEQELAVEARRLEILNIKQANQNMREAAEAKRLEILNIKQANQNMREAAEAKRLEMLNIKLANQNMRQEHILRMREQRLKIRILEEQEENLQGQPST
ncbi:regulatory protein zeste-like [Drosophila nasuta]|uniref:regulatory protein zeste-like n=1 Tax=Drosophila nasuta TaxID=42062 RepID=UPI00295F56D6|nr:regulatory protein zeste-like [Drosophila nasuta]